MAKVYVCYTMTCVGLCDIWVRITHELYGDLGITSRQYTSRNMVWQLNFPWDVVLIVLGDDRVRSGHNEILVLSLVI